MLNEIILGSLLTFIGYRLGVAVGMIRTLKVWHQSVEKEDPDFLSFIQRVSATIDRKTEEPKDNDRG